MASVRKVGKKWRVELYRNGKRESAMFVTKAEAAAWALQREAEMDGRALPYKTFAEAMDRYIAEISPTHRGHRFETMRVRVFKRHRIANRPLGKLAPEDLIEWRDERLKAVSAASVLRELNIINSVLEAARIEWRWIRENPLKDVRKPEQPKGRRRRISQDEIDAITAHVGYEAGATPDSLTKITVAAFLFAIETGMRAGEILGLTWADVHERYVVIRKSKNGESREVPLSKQARLILAGLKDGVVPFSVRPGTRDALFRKTVRAARKAAVEANPKTPADFLTNLHFHDSRSQAIFNLSKKLDVLELSRVIGHRDINSLRHYYNTTAEELADRL